MVKRKDACDSLPKSSQEVFSATMLMSTCHVIAILRRTPILVRTGSLLKSVKESKRDGALVVWAS